MNEWHSQIMSSIRAQQQQLISSGLSKVLLFFFCKNKKMDIKEKTNLGHSHKLGMKKYYFHELIHSNLTIPDYKLI